MKKKLIKILGLLFISATMFACTQGGDSSKDEQLPPEPPKALSLDVSSTSLILCDSMQLNANYGEIAGAELEFTSSNPAIVAVDENGIITAENVGLATITATYGEQSATCLVSVTTNNYSPYLIFENEINDTMTVSATEDINLGALIGFNGNTYSGEITYTIEDPTIGEMVDDYFVPAKTGETTVTVEGDWKGFESATLVKSINVKVIDDIEVALNGGVTHDIQIYTVEEHQGKTYATSADFDVVVKVNGEAISADVTVAEGDNVVSIDSTAGKINALSYGSAKIEISFTDSSDNELMYSVDVHVKRPVADYENTVGNFSALDGELPLEEIFGQSVTVTEAWNGATQLTVEDNKVLGLQVSNTELTKTVITVYTDKVAYNVPVEACTKWISTADDFKALKVASTTTTGYYVLANDIGSATDYVKNIDGSSSALFGAVLDGNGHSVYVQVPQYGLFGKPVEGAAIKNIGIYVVDFSTANSTSVNHRAILFRSGSHGTLKTSTVTIENIYVEVNAGEKNLDHLCFLPGENAYYYKVKDAIFNVVGNVPVIKRTNNSLIFNYWTSTIPGWSSAYPTLENVNFITMREPIVVTTDDLVWFAQNDKAARDAFTPTSYGLEKGVLRTNTSGMFGWSGTGDNVTEMNRRVVFRYDTAADMYADENARQVGNWTVSENGVISWNAEA